MITSDKNDWDKNPPIRPDSNWYTEGSKMDYDVRAGIYGRKPRKSLLLRFVKERVRPKRWYFLLQPCSNSSSSLESVDTKDLGWDCVR